jgi:hypothetical protein
VVERFLGKKEVVGPIPTGSSNTLQEARMKKAPAKDKTRKKMIANSKKRAVKVDYSLELNKLVFENMNKSLKKLGVAKKSDVQKFMRGAIFAGIAMACNAETKQWQEFVDAIQPLAKKHLGMGLKLEGKEAYIRSGEID